jgi:hypothetical protein
MATHELPTMTLVDRYAWIDRRLLPALALALPVVAFVLLLHVTRFGGLGDFELQVSFGLFACIVATASAVVGYRPRVGIAVVAFLLTANTGFLLSTLSSLELLAMPAPDWKFVLVLSAGMMLGVVGLVLRRPWARWLCLALGATGLGSGGLNAINMWEITSNITEADTYVNPEWCTQMFRIQWIYFVNALGGALIVLNLVAARRAFVAAGVWSGREPVMRVLRLSMIASFVAVPMLLVYAWMQPIVPATQTTAVVLAAGLTLGAVLAVRGKLVGAVILVVAGLGLLAQTLVTMLLADDRFIASYYLVFWTPAAVLAIVSGALLARPVLRVLRR